MKYSLLLSITLLLFTVSNYGIEALVVDSMETAANTVTVSNPIFGSSSSRILKSHTYGSYPNNWNKTVTYKASPGCGIVVAIRQVDFRSLNLDKLRIFDPADVRSAVVISNPSYFRNRSYDSLERRTIYSQRGVLSVNFDTGPGSTFSYDGFELIVTAYSAGIVCSYSEFRCWNSRCIADSLKCDGHNHCGDRSDQINCSYTPKRNVTAISVGIVFLVIALIAIIVLIFRRASRSRSSVTTTIHPPPTNLSGYPPPGTCYPPPPPPYTQYSSGHVNPGYQ